MEFRHLASFIAIAEELHFGKAAARLHLTQPSLSAQLQKLEKSLGVQLVVRNSHEVRLTSAGEDFEAHARLIMRQMEQAASSAQSTAAGLCGSLNVGYNMPAGRYILPYAMARMSRSIPTSRSRCGRSEPGPNSLVWWTGRSIWRWPMGVRTGRTSGTAGFLRTSRSWRSSAAATAGPAARWSVSPIWPANSV